MKTTIFYSNYASRWCVGVDGFASELELALTMLSREQNGEFVARDKAGNFEEVHDGIVSFPTKQQAEWFANELKKM